MAYIRTKIIKGKPYTYLQESKRVGKNVVTMHVRYIAQGRKETKEKFLTEVTNKDNFDSDDNPKHKKKLGTTNNLIYGSLHDKRSNEKIAKDISKNAKETFNKPNQWEETGKSKSDLQGWDTHHIKTHRKKFVNVFKPTKKQLKKQFPNAKFSGRLKTLSSMIKKLKKKNVNEKFTQHNFEDIIGTRLTFKNEKELKKGIKVIRKNFKIREEEDYITKPKGGYRSFHFTIENKGKPIELQFRTPNQTKWADWMHDRLYDNVEKTKKKIGKKGFSIATKYAEKMSKYYEKLDKGIKAIKPKTPEVVKNKLGGGMK